MNCNGCGTQLADAQNPDVVNQAVDDILEASLKDAHKHGGVCPLCGHSKYIPFFYRRGTEIALLVVAVLLIAASLVSIEYYRSPLRSSVAQEAIRRASVDSEVNAALGAPIRAGILATGAIREDGTGWSEAKFTVPISGPKGHAALHVVAGRAMGPWIYNTLEVEIDLSPKTKRVDLLRGKLEISEGSYVQVHTEPAVQPEFINSIAPTPTWDGTSPIVIITPVMARDGSIRLEHSLSTYKPTVQHNAPVNSFEVNLRYGMFVLRQTDLFVKDTMPLVFTRTFRGWDDNIHALGKGGNHPYDICPTATRNPYTEMDINLEDSLPVHFERISKGTGYADAWYEHTGTSSEFYKARIWWNGDGWTLHFADGRIVLFPESYNGKTFAQGAPYEIRNAQGQTIHLNRDGPRNLRNMVSPNGRVITFQYDGANRVTEAVDDAGNRVKYTYDAEGRVIAVDHDTIDHNTANQNTANQKQPDEIRQNFRFKYHEDGIVLIADGAGHTLLYNEYDDGGRISQQTLAGGATYRYRYVLTDKNRPSQTIVTLPDGTEKTFSFAQEAPFY